MEGDEQEPVPEQIPNASQSVPAAVLMKDIVDDDEDGAPETSVTDKPQSRRRAAPMASTFIPTAGKWVDLAITVYDPEVLDEMLLEDYRTVAMGELYSLETIIRESLAAKQFTFENHDQRKMKIIGKPRMWCFPRNDGFVVEKMVDPAKKKLEDECFRYNGFKIHVQVTFTMESESVAEGNVPPSETDVKHKTEPTRLE
jgi:hypothetical protein